MENNIEIFSTKDLALAATLISLKFPMYGYDMVYEGTKPTEKAYFKFKKDAHLEDAIMKYRSRLLAIEPQLLVSTIRDLKQEINNEMSSPNPWNKGKA